MPCSGSHAWATRASGQESPVWRVELQQPVRHLRPTCRCSDPRAPCSASLARRPHASRQQARTCACA
eukprot:5359109-Alexandrium_andersonii.AAC.1